MSTTKAQIEEWFERGLQQGATHMIVVCDTFDHEDYPAFVSPDEDARKVAEERYGYPGEKNMQRVMEVYDLRLDRAIQISEARAFHLTPAAGPTTLRPAGVSCILSEGLLTRLKD